MKVSIHSYISAIDTLILAMGVERHLRCSSPTVGDNLVTSSPQAVEAATQSKRSLEKEVGP